MQLFENAISPSDSSSRIEEPNHSRVQDKAPSQKGESLPRPPPEKLPFSLIFNT